MTTAARVPSAGDRISEYALEEPLGEGAFGLVWKARHVVLSGKVVAIKLPRDPERLHLLKQEGILLHHLKHPGIVRVLGIDLDADVPYLVQEYVPGRDLDALLESEGPLSLERTMDLLEEMARILEYAHGQGVVHRDLKPSNILIDPDGRAHIADFGLGMSVEDAQSSMLRLSLSGLSASCDRDLLGTWEYMAPEQRSGSISAGQSDLYALGVMLHEMLTGERPAGRGGLETICSGVDRIFGRLYTSASQRYGSAAELLADIRRWRKGRLRAVAPPSPPVAAPNAPNAPNASRAVRRRGTMVRSLGQAVFFLLFPVLALAAIYFFYAPHRHLDREYAAVRAAEIAPLSEEYLKLFKDPDEAVRLSEVRTAIERHPEDVLEAIDALSEFITKAREPALLEKALRWKRALSLVREPHDYEVKLKRFRVHKETYAERFHSWLEPGSPDIYVRVYRTRNEKKELVFDGCKAPIEGWSGAWEGSEESPSASFQLSWKEGEPIEVELWEDDVFGDNLLARFVRGSGLSILALSTPLISPQHHSVELESSFALGE